MEVCDAGQTDVVHDDGAEHAERAAGRRAALNLDLLTWNPAPEDTDAGVYFQWRGDPAQPPDGWVDEYCIGATGFVPIPSEQVKAAAPPPKVQVKIQPVSVLSVVPEAHPADRKRPAEAAGADAKRPAVAAAAAGLPGEHPRQSIIRLLATGQPGGTEEAVCALSAVTETIPPSAQGAAPKIRFKVQFTAHPGSLQQGEAWVRKDAERAAYERLLGWTAEAVRQTPEWSPWGDHRVLTGTCQAELAQLHAKQQQQSPADATPQALASVKRPPAAMAKRPPATASAAGALKTTGAASALAAATVKTPGASPSTKAPAGAWKKAPGYSSAAAFPASSAVKTPAHAPSVKSPAVVSTKMAAAGPAAASKGKAPAPPVTPGAQAIAAAKRAKGVPGQRGSTVPQPNAGGWAAAGAAWGADGAGADWAAGGWGQWGGEWGGAPAVYGGDWAGGGGW